MKLEKRDILSALILLIVVVVFFLVATTKQETSSAQETVRSGIMLPYRGEVQLFNYAVPSGRVACSVVPEGVSCVFVPATPRRSGSFS